MASFADLVPLTETVNVRGRDFEVCGLREGVLGQLVARYPEIETMLRETSEVSAAEILKLGIAAVSAIIAAGTGKFGDQKEEAKIAELAIGEKVAFLDAIARLTLPQGVGPFAGLARTLGLDALINEAKSLMLKNLPASSDSSGSSPMPAIGSSDLASPGPTL